LFNLVTWKQVGDPYWPVNNIESTMPYSYLSNGTNGDCVYNTPTSDQTVIGNFSVIPNMMYCSLFTKLVGNELLRQFIVGRTVYFFMIKTLNATCKRNLPTRACPTSPSLDINEVDKTNIGNGTKDWHKYGTEQANNAFFDV